MPSTTRRRPATAREPHPPTQRRTRALDGLRGLAVIAVMAYHVIPDPFTGGWLGVDVFLVLSGYLIATMLLREHERTGTINYRRFLTRRARRLLPGLALMLLAVLAAAAILETAGRRATVAVDVLSSAAQISNWRLILANESYFAKVSAPSPIRHTWSLGVQEQFYLLLPLALLFLFTHLRTYRSLILVFTLTAAASLATMIVLYQPGTDPSRVYFGTETRLFELLIGVIGAIALHRRTRRATRARRPLGPRGWTRRTEHAIGWAGLTALTALVTAMFSVDEFSPWLFTGGLALIAAATMLIITAATSPTTNIMTRLLAARPLTVAGDRSYSLYIWHWPVIVYLTPFLDHTHQLTQAFAAIAVTIAISTLSYTYVEHPIHARGLTRWLRSRPRLGPALAIAVIPALTAGSTALATTTGPASNSNVAISLPTDPHYGKTPEQLPEDVPRHDVVLIGASTVARLVERGQPEKTPDITLTPTSSFGCAPWLRDEVHGDGKPPESADCRNFRDSWPTAIAAADNPTAVFVLPTRILTDYRTDGTTAAPPSPEYDAVVTGILDELDTAARDAGASRVAFVNMPCHELADFGGDPIIERANTLATVKHLNQVIDAWAKKSGADVYDNYSLLCPGDTYYDTINGQPLYDDGLHYSTQSAPLMWQWFAHQVRTHTT